VSFIRTQPIIDIEDIIIILVIVTLIVRGLARFGQHSTRIMCRFISELRVADVIRFQDIGRKLP
jgi:hypothetical protein